VALASGECRAFADFARELAELSRAVIRESIARGFDVQHKPDGSFVTSADVAVEDRLRERIAERYPTHGIVGEERPPTNPAAEFQWILDPIDGTEDFVQRMPTFGTIIGLHFRNLPIAGVVDHPLLDVRMSASFGGGTWRNGTRVRVADVDPATPDEQLRLMLSARANFIRHRDNGHLFDALTRRFPNQRIYRSCYAHTCVASGQVDVMVEYGNRVWDLAAAQLLVEEAGGHYRVIQDVDTPGVGRDLGAAFGAGAAVARVCRVLADAGKAA
jgi:fructose-1,6-bisphosphatase/inositol monophosphatase family enzyme